MTDPDAVLAAIITQLPAGRAVDFDRPLTDAGIDSLDFVEIVMHLESHFGVELDVDRIDDKMSIRAFAQWVAASLVHGAVR